MNMDTSMRPSGGTLAATIPNIAAATDVALYSHYRMGDVVAAMLMMSLVDAKAGPKRWWLAEPNPLFATLGQFVWVGGDVAPTVAPLVEYKGNGDGLVELPDDGRLWIWNDVCYRTGYRMEAAPSRQRPYRIIFAPLYEADYATERCMHPYFARDVARHLSQFEDAVMLLPERINVHDLELVRDIPIPKVHAPLIEVVEMIGNAELFVGGDTGLSHVAGLFGGVKQIELHDRENTARHVEREFDHMKSNREHVLGICEQLGIDVTDAEYRSFANKPEERGARYRLYDNGGMDGETMRWLLHTIGELL